MKYLRKFNEELKSSTYKLASNKLKGMGHIRRSSELEKWSEEVANKEKDARELESFNSFKHDVPFRISIIKSLWNGAGKPRTEDVIVSGNFYIKPSFDAYWARDNYDDNVNHAADGTSDGTMNYKYMLPFEIGIMAADEESKEKFRAIESKLSDEVYEGVYWLQRLYYPIIAEGSKIVEPNGEYFWECRENDQLFFDSRSEAMRFKKMFVDAIHGRNDFTRSKWVPEGLHKQLENFFSGNWISDDKKQPDTFNDEAFQKFLNSVNRMSVNQLYRN